MKIESYNSIDDTIQEKFKNKEWLYRKYSKEKMSCLMISKICKVDTKTIRYWLCKFNIQIRSLNEANQIAKANHIILSENTKEIIIGGLYGDGALTLNENKKSAYISYGCLKYKEFAEYLKKLHDSVGIKRVKGRPFWDKRYKRYYYRCNSRSYIELANWYEKWYEFRDGHMRKKLPDIIDYKLTPIICLLWYLGDGYLYNKKNRRSSIILCTYGFRIEHVRIMIKQLKEIGFKAIRYKSNNTIGIETKSTKEFLDYIGTSPVRCYNYKWNYQDNRMLPYKNLDDIIDKYFKEYYKNEKVEERNLNG